MATLGFEVNSNHATVAQPVYRVHGSTVTVTRIDVSSAFLISGAAYLRPVNADAWQQRGAADRHCSCWQLCPMTLQSELSLIWRWQLFT